MWEDKAKNILYAIWLAAVVGYAGVKTHNYLDYKNANQQPKIEQSMEKYNQNCIDANMTPDQMDKAVIDSVKNFKLECSKNDISR